MKKLLFLPLLISLLSHCDSAPENSDSDSFHFTWDNANVYFMMIDRFKNGDPSNDFAFDRPRDGAALRNFEGGDLRGIIQKLDDGYFSDLGITAIWFTPPVEQIKGAVNEGYGNMYAFHGYWARDWTNIDPAFGTMDDFAEFVEKAHGQGIRVLLDVVVNHTGPVTDLDSQWPDSWVRTKPRCSYQDWNSTIECTLVDNLPDVRTESDKEVELPKFLIEKWKEEGRLEKEIEELDAFFAETGYPRAPRFYIMKWLSDYVREFGVDGYRVDTVKHVDEDVWAELRKIGEKAFSDWKSNNPEKILDETPFYMVGEAYHYNIEQARDFKINGHEHGVDYFTHGFSSMINFGFKWHTQWDESKLFAQYNEWLQSDDLKGFSTLNYISSHDDDAAADRHRTRSIELGTKLLLSPGMSQVYYGDETARKLFGGEGVSGDAHLRTFMNWEDLEEEPKSKLHPAYVLKHWQKLGRFRKMNPSVGAGVHTELSQNPFVFSRTYSKNDIENKVLVALHHPETEKSISVYGTFEDGTRLWDYYSETWTIVRNGSVNIDSPYEIVLLAEK